MEVHAAPGGARAAPAVHIVHQHERFELTLRVTPCEHRDVLLIEVTLTGEAGLRPYALLAPHLGGTGANNLAQVLEYRGRRALCAEQGPYALSLAAVTPEQQDAWGRASAGYVGSSDGWQDFARHGALTWDYDTAGPGNVALAGELPRHAILALGFANSPESATTLARTALTETFAVSWERQLTAWTRWHAVNASEEALAAELPETCAAQVQISTVVLRVHQDKTYPGAMVASLSVPWGNTREEREGYHLVWPRDLCESAGALLAIGALREARNALGYLHRHAERRRPLESEPVARRARPLAGRATRRDGLPGAAGRGAGGAQRARRHGGATTWCAAHLSFLVRQGPVTDQDRWEEDAGLNTFTLAVCICSAGRRRALPARGRARAGARLRRLLERAAGGVDQRPRHPAGAPLRRARLLRAGRPAGLAHRRPGGAGERAADPQPAGRPGPGRPVRRSASISCSWCASDCAGRMIRSSSATLKVADALLKVDTPAGPCWHRYNEDGYGEHDDGRAYDGTGRGRAWPLLTGERGHYELCAGRDPLPYLEAMARMASSGGMLPEQIWDAAPLAARGLLPGPADGGGDAAGVGARGVPEAGGVARPEAAL